MTSEAKIAANRRNAQRSTGPRTASGKARIRHNAFKHGLAALAVRDPAVAAEVKHLAAVISTEGSDPADCRQAPIIAECEVALRRVRAARVRVMEEMSLMPPPQKRGARASPPVADQDRLQHCLNQLGQLERYERRALSQRKRALRLPSLSDP